MIFRILIKKAKRIVKDPKYVFFVLYNRLRRLRIKRVEHDDNLFLKYKGVLYPEYLFRKNASSYIIDRAKRYCDGCGLDIGAGGWPFPGSIPVEDLLGQNALKLDNFPDGSLDYIFSSHCLEHLKEWQRALKLWIRKVKSGGILFLYLPHESMELWKPGGIFGFQHKWLPNYRALNEFLKRNGLEIIDYEKERDRYWSFYVIARKL